MKPQFLRGDKLWDKIESQLNVKIPVHLKFIFKIQSADRPEVLENLTPDGLQFIEEFVRSDAYAQEISAGSNPLEYYGNQQPDNFSFSREDSDLITRITQLISQNVPDFWKAEEEVREHIEKNVCDWKTSTFLEMLNFSSYTNKEKRSTGHRFEDHLKRVCTFVNMIGGPLLYDFMNSNLPIPDKRTITNYMCNAKIIVAEGTLRVSELKTFLDARNLPKKVCISEDLTGICGRIQYDSRLNQIVGLVLPHNQHGMPITYAFPATSAQVIEGYSKKSNAASYLHVFMAQPLDENAPPFCLSMFGSDNKMTQKDVSHRLNYIAEILEKNGIEVCVYSADGDPRVLKAMRLHMKLENQESPQGKRKRDASMHKFYIEGFQGEILPKQVCIQDTVHLGNKLKNRFFKKSIVLPMGNYTATSGGITALVEITRKDEHFLTETDLTLNDKMNFASTMNICHPRIWHLLEVNVPSSYATQMYLKIIFFTMQSMLSTKLTPLERIHCAWFGLFFVRMWRYWLFKQKNYSYIHNFISMNSYVCMELNAHGLLNMIFRCLEENSFQHFLPWLFSSQPCEGFFRNLRSMTSTFSTVVNCSVLDALHKMERLQLMADINGFDFGPNETIHFPRTRFLNASNEKQVKTFPELKKIDDPVSIETIRKIILEAKNDAQNEIKHLGMKVPLTAADKIQVDFHETASEDFFDDIDAEDVRRYEIADSNEIDSVDKDVEILSVLDKTLNLPDFAEKFPYLKDDSPETVIKDSKGNPEVVKKSSLCWFFSNKNKKLSSDRNIRVREAESRNITDIHRLEISELRRQEKFHINEYCLFKTADSESCLIGLISGFAYMNETTWKEIAYYKTFVEIGKSSQKNVGVLARWFVVDSDTRSLVLYPIKIHGYVDINQYKLSIPAPVQENGKFILPEEVLNKISSLLLKN